MKKIGIILLVAALWAPAVQAQKAALKTNLLYGAYTYTPNLGLELGLGTRSTLELTGGYNPWNLDGSDGNNKKAVHWLAQVEYRYWFCRKFNGHFIGVHGLGSQYNISQHELPLLFGKGSKDYRYEGWAAGGGVSYGYQWILGNRWGLEVTAGVGYARLRYDKYECKRCGTKLGSEYRNYWGPTKVGVSLIFIIK